MGLVHILSVGCQKISTEPTWRGLPSHFRLTFTLYNIQCIQCILYYIQCIQCILYFSSWIAFSITDCIQVEGGEIQMKGTKTSPICQL